MSISASGEETGSIEARTQAIGRELYARMARYRPAPAEKAGDAAMLLLAEAPRFRARLLRFVDALASLQGPASDRHVQDLLREYLAADFPQLPAAVRALTPVARWGGWPAPLVAAGARGGARSIASRFIASGDDAGLRRAMDFLRRRRRYPSFDVLGEYVASEAEADAYRDRYLDLLTKLSRAPEARRPAPSGVDALQVSLKLSSLTADFNPLDPAGTLRRMQPRLTQILEAARAGGVGVTLDMERYETRDLVQSIFFAVCGRGAQFGDWEGIGVVLQAYLRDAAEQAEALLAFAAERGARFQVRLVKGAYWDYETVVAEENGWPAPVWQAKDETDRAFEQLSERLVAAHPFVRTAIASHNLRSHAHAEAVRESLRLPRGAVEHQVLYRTAEGVARALTSMGWGVRDYVPLGELLPGMAYLVRRILENSSQVGFLVHSRSGESAERLLAPPKPRDLPPRPPSLGGKGEQADGGHARFRNQPPARLFRVRERAEFAQALASAREEFGRDYRPMLGDGVRDSGEVAEVRSPSHPDWPPIGYVHNAGEIEVARALERAGGALPDWSAHDVGERARLLRRAAELLAERRGSTGAWIVHEAAKSWTEALADVDEAIDYLRYYALQAEALSELWRDYHPRGVVAVIPPWNFPIAIPCGMAAAALVAGNAVVLKPAEQTPLIAWRLVEILHEAGVPEDVLVWLPGRGDVAGHALVASPHVDMVAFTGSRTVGAAIYREGCRVVPARGGLRATVAEMGGKNAILVFPDADLDEAVVGILQSAFGHANQKCSAASRVLIQDAIYDRLRQRLVEGADSLPSGPADAPGTLITPLIDDEARARVGKAASRARVEGHVLLDDLTRAQPPASGPVLAEFTAQQSATAQTTQEEIFGPVLALIPFRNEREAVRIANGTPYALTAGVFSRSPATVARVTAALDAGNIYVNRPVTGARVGVEPFGGHKLSGTGPKAGGADYLWAFVTRRQRFRSGCRSSFDTIGKSEAVGGRAASGEVRAVRRWSAPPSLRGEIVGNALTHLRQDTTAGPGPGEGRPTPDSRYPIEILRRLDEIARPQPTLRLAGQQSVVRWDRPRGCGLVLTDAGASDESLLALVVGSLLAGNGVVVRPEPTQRSLIARLFESLRRFGVPDGVAILAPESFDAASGVALPQVTFAAVDLCEDETRAVYRLLADASAMPESPYLEALITLADGPAPDQPGFLRRFALPKTVAVRTLHLGADLELIDMAGE
jgi:RHH-type proline utilization regulon transcriptional repressor/proline dehydrogenase/delta 1-pyrroline-5-carboxylate dehydrogenase